MVAGTGTDRGGHSDLQAGAMPLSSHTTAGAGRLGTLLRSQPSRAARGLRTWPTGALDAIGLQTRLRLGPIQQVRGLPLPKVGLPSRCFLPALEKGAPMPVMIGVDPHKTSHTAAALDEHGQLLDHQRISATLDGYQQLRQWAGRWPHRCWAIEGAHGVGRALAQRLVGDGEQVLDVPAKLAARVRVLSVGHGRKSDPDDAVSVAIAAQSVPALRQVGVEDQATVLHLLTKRRQDLVAARTQSINRLHRLLMDLVPGGARRNLTAKRAAALLAAVTSAGQPAVTRWQLAATFLGEVGDIGRFPSKHHFAAHTGTGQVTRHRLSRPAIAS
jgi:transposase